MSDEFDDDDFLVDDSFLREVDNIEAEITTKPPPKPLTAQKGWTGSRQNVASGSRQPITTAASAARAKTLIPSSDDYDDFSLGPESLVALDVPAPPPIRAPLSRSSSGNAGSSSSTSNSNVIPSSHLGMKRTNSSSANNPMFQVHLNFRKLDQTTKGKRWDRTAFAESGRRIDAEKAKKKGKYKARTWARDDDDEDLDEEDFEDDEPLVPGPKPLVDTSAPYEPQRHTPNEAAIATYIYPTNKPKRDYQYDIIRACFTDNCLVALPTGLGKTFIAGVVMLNFYRWFPTGKIVFLAPTKPLVNQQIEACQLTCGIPSSDAAVMTGQSVPARERARMWAERRVFYCTPQTLDNDLKTGSVDPCDIVLAVFDEAHKASGSYAYTTILAYITAQNPYFRVLALTATPGADVPKVQAVVDALHISRIEIREAEAPEIRKYMNEKHTNKHRVLMGEVIEGFRDRWAALIRPYVKKLVDRDILTERDLDIKRLKPFRLTAKRMEIARHRDSNMKWCFGSLTAIEKMARAMGNLLEFSLGMFHTTLTEIAGNTNANGKKATTGGASNAMRNNFEFVKLLRDVEAEMNCIRIGQRGKTKADRHPKMVKTLELLLQHFTDAQEDEDIHGVKNDTRAMVFCSYRECVMEIVDMLNDHPDLLRATKFVGQSQGKKEADKGFNQKEQKKTISDFKEGIFNVLVSTSIGEEGLDIGEVDFVVIYDMPKQSIKLLQRIGRTGRKRDGKVHVLMSEDREDSNWDTAQRTHRDIQEEILHSRNLELFEDVERLLPAGALPTCVEEFMPVDPWDPGEKKVKRKLAAAKNVDADPPPKKKQRGHEIPEGGHEGFKSVAELLRDAGKLSGGEPSKPRAKGKQAASSRRQKLPSFSEDEEEEEEEVEEDEELLYGPVKGKSAGQARGKVKKAGPRGATRSRIRTQTTQKTDTQRAASVEEMEREEKRRKSQRDEFNKSALDFFNTEGPVRQKQPTPPTVSPPQSPPIGRKGTKRPAASLDPDASPAARRNPTDVEGKLSPGTAAAVGFSQIAAIDLSWDDDDIATPVNDVKQVPTSPMLTAPSRPSPSIPPSLPSSRQSETLVPHPRSRIMGISRPKATQTKSMDVMPPPLLPVSHATPSPHPLHTPISEASQAVRRPGVRRRPANIIPSSEEKPNGVSDEGDSPFLPPNRRRRLPAPSTSPDVPLARTTANRPSSPSDVPSSPVRRRQRRQRKRAPAAQIQEYLDMDVEVSGSDSGDEPSTDEENESDRLFAGSDFAPTQAPKGYNQRAIYAAGLSTQAAPQAGLKFKPQGDKVAFMAKARRPVLVTDDERSDDSENEYELGSFVCPDEDLSFDTQSEPMSGR